MVTKEELIQKQSMPLDMKIKMSERRIRDFYEHNSGNVFVAFSGGLDSTVVLHLVRNIYPNCGAVFCLTPDYRLSLEFIKRTENVIWIKGKKTFHEVCKEKGVPYPTKVMACSIRKLKHQNLSDEYKNKLLNGDSRGTFGMVSKKYQWLIKSDLEVSEECCDILKKRPMKKFVREHNKCGIITGTKASDTTTRKVQYLRRGCFDNDNNKLDAIGFWTDDDVKKYLKIYSVPYCVVYDEGIHHTGCKYCLFGIESEPRPNRFDWMREHEPEDYRYAIEVLQLQRYTDKVLPEVK